MSDEDARRVAEDLMEARHKLRARADRWRFTRFDRKLARLVCRLNATGLARAWRVGMLLGRPRPRPLGESAAAEIVQAASTLRSVCGEGIQRPDREILKDARRAARRIERAWGRHYLFMARLYLPVLLVDRHAWEASAPWNSATVIGHGGGGASRPAAKAYLRGALRTEYRRRWHVAPWDAQPFRPAGLARELFVVSLGGHIGVSRYVE